MRKYLLALLVSVGLIVGGLGAGSASAVTQTGYCTTSGSQGVDVAVRLDHPTYYNFNDVGWDTNPNALLNRITITLAESSSGTDPYLLWSIGGTSTTPDDVASGATNYVPGGWPKTILNGGRYWRASVWGGSGDSNGSCNTGWIYMS